MLLYSYRDDYSLNPRFSEDSRRVVRSWQNPRVVYAVEPSIDAPLYWKAVAERILVRRLLGYGALEDGQLPLAAHARVFGETGPELVELLAPYVSFAMAYVPLTPLGETGRPYLARLYCVKGLGHRHAPSLDGMDEAGISDFSWFITGLQETDLANIRGRSWLLAAHLLMRVLRKSDASTAKNLMTHFIVTGDVVNGEIRKVTMLKKADLARFREFSDFKWILPKENDMDIPTRKIEKPASLEEAYSLIENMQSVATRSLFRFLHEGNLEGAQEQYRIGADIYAVEESTGLVPLQIVAKELEKVRNQKVEEKKEKDPFENGEGRGRNQRICDLNRIMAWLKSENADCALSFYLAAKVPGDNLLKSLCNEYPINAIDENGLTAVDWALRTKSWDLAAKLHRFGCACNPRPYGALKRALKGYCHAICDTEPGDRTLIAKAVEFGLSPDTRVKLSHEGFTGPGPDADCTLFGIAVNFSDYEMMEVCLRNGADVNGNLSYTRTFYDPIGREHIEINVPEMASGTPWTIISSRYNAKSEKVQRIQALLRRYGAKEAVPETDAAK